MVAAKSELVNWQLLLLMMNLTGVKDISTNFTVTLYEGW